MACLETTIIPWLPYLERSILAEKIIKTMRDFDGYVRREPIIMDSCDVIITDSDTYITNVLYVISCMYSRVIMGFKILKLEDFINGTLDSVYEGLCNQNLDVLNTIYNIIQNGVDKNLFCKLYDIAQSDNVKMIDDYLKSMVGG